MTHPILSDEQARALFTTLHNTTFDWTATQVPALMAELGWTIDDTVTIPGKAALADVPWGLPQVAVDLQFTGDVVNAFYIPLVSPARDPAAQLEVADAFARFALLLADIFGSSGTRVPGEHPGLRWRHENVVLKLQGGTKTMFAFWARADFQDSLDKVAAG